MSSTFFTLVHGCVLNCQKRLPGARGEFIGTFKLYKLKATGCPHSLVVERSCLHTS